MKLSKRGRGRRGARGAGRGGTNAASDAEPFPWWVLKKMKKAAKEGVQVK